MAEPKIVNLDPLDEIRRAHGEHWGVAFKLLTPSMRERGGRLGVKWMRGESGRSACPFHSYQREDEVFFVLCGRGVLRHGEQFAELRPGDCVACPAGTGEAHQIANPWEEDLVYLATGPHDPDEVCVYPDSGKVRVRSLQRTGWLQPSADLEGEPECPLILGYHRVHLRRREGPREQPPARLPRRSRDAAAQPRCRSRSRRCPPPQAVRSCRKARQPGQVTVSGNCASAATSNC